MESDLGDRYVSLGLAPILDRDKRLAMRTTRYVLSQQQ